ncbi:MAG TPA: FxsA family protein [Aliiroseovarius sp.]|nr:FxsA family protein [Aliiroseovarius sp.]
MWLFLLFVAVPLIEIGLFIQVGGAIGLWPTLAIVVFTAVLGTWMLRAQGVRTIEKLRRSLTDMEDPTEQLAHGAMLLFSAALLLTPGFFTDAIGFLLLFPPVRSMVFRALKGRVGIAAFSVRPMQPGEGPHCRGYEGASNRDIIDGEFTEVDPGVRPTHPPTLGGIDPTRH